MEEKKLFIHIYIYICVCVLSMYVAALQLSCTIKIAGASFEFYTQETAAPTECMDSLEALHAVALALSMNDSLDSQIFILATQLMLEHASPHLLDVIAADSSLFRAVPHEVWAGILEQFGSVGSEELRASALVALNVHLVFWKHANC